MHWKTEHYIFCGSYTLVTCTKETTIYVKPHTQIEHYSLLSKYYNFKLHKYKYTVNYVSLDCAFLDLYHSGEK
jgi:hypothetical protein